MTKHLTTRYAEIGCRIPREYFCVIGWGESEWVKDLVRAVRGIPVPVSLTEINS
jgi:hypothetical protein